MTLDDVIQVALEDIPIQQAVVRPEFQSDYLILDHGHRFGVYLESAWHPQTESLLPWSPPPSGALVAKVHLDGQVDRQEGIELPGDAFNQPQPKGDT